MKVLIVEDNIILSKNISKYLELEAINNDIANTSKDALYKISTGDFDCILLDVNIDELNGLDICKIIRDKGINTPIIMLTAKDNIEDKIAGLDQGADDYITKPFDYDELVARVKSSVRRTYIEKSQLIKKGDLEIDLDKKIIKKASKEVVLTTLEYRLLEYLLHLRGSVVSKENLIEKVWGSLEKNMNSRSVDMYISHLRKKLGKDIIETKKGLGYIIK